MTGKQYILQWWPYNCPPSFIFESVCGGIPSCHSCITTQLTLSSLISLEALLHDHSLHCCDWLHDTSVCCLACKTNIKVNSGFDRSQSSACVHSALCFTCLTSNKSSELPLALSPSSAVHLHKKLLHSKATASNASGRTDIETATTMEIKCYCWAHFINRIHL